MSSFYLIFIIIVLVALILLLIFLLFKKKRHFVQTESTVLLKSIEKVCKIITVEGNFVEIVTHFDTKSYLFNIIKSTKKAIVTVKAKAIVNFDMKMIKITSNRLQKKIEILEIPQPEINICEPEINYYDIDSDIINRFDKDDYNHIYRKSLEHLKKQAADSNLIIIAKQQLSESIQLLNIIAQSTGWEIVLCDNSIKKYQLKN